MGTASTGKGKVFGERDASREPWPRSRSRPISNTPSRSSDTELLFVHRKLADGEIYWVSNRNDRAENVEASLPRYGQSARTLARRYGRGRTRGLHASPNGRTTVPLHLEPNDAVFVVFRKAAAAPSRTLPQAGRDHAQNGGRRLGCRVPAEPRRAGQDHAARAGLVAARTPTPA